jgi:4-amino-4-deoxy-L-arabinose transferase-like glycosyltransferase
MHRAMTGALHDRRWFRLACAAILLFWLGARAIYWNGYYTEDAPGYVTDAIWTALGEYHARDHVNGLNVGTYLPVALPIVVLGKSEFALVLWPLFSSLVGLLSLTGATAHLFGRPYAILAALVYAAYPGDVFFSTVVMPDAMQAGWLCASVFFIVRGFSGPVDRRWRWLFAAGLAMGVCHLIRGNDALLLPVGVAGTAILSRIAVGDTAGAVMRSCAAYLSGYVVVNVLEGLVYLWAVGDFLHRFHVIHRHYGAMTSIQQWGLNTDWRTIPYSAFAPLLWWQQDGWGQLNQDQAYHALTFCFALIAIVIALAVLIARRGTISDRQLAGFVLAVFWFAWPLLFHQFGSQSVTRFVPIHRLSRHLVVYAPGAIFAIVAGSCLVASALSSARHASLRRLALALGMAALAVQLAFAWTGELIAYNAYHRIKDTYARIRDRLPSDVRIISADPGDLCFFDFWMNPLRSERVKIMAFANYARCEDLTSGVVLTYSNPGWEGLSAPVIQQTVARLPCLVYPPATWRLLYRGSPEHVFVIEKAADRSQRR